VTLGALGGCLSEGGDPLDVASTPSASSRESGDEANAMSGAGLDVNGSIDPAMASSLAPDKHRQGGDPGIPPKVDPGTPTYASSSAPIAVEPVGFDPARSMLERIYRADLQAGGESFWFDRMLERPVGGSDGNALFTRGRALYMYTHNPAVLGFAGQGTGANIGGGGTAYREAIQIGNSNCRPGPGSPCNLYSVTVSDATLTEATAERRQYPSYWSSVHTADGLTVHQRKFITHNNVAVTVLEITSSDPPERRSQTSHLSEVRPSWVRPCRARADNVSFLCELPVLPPCDKLP